MKNDNNNFEEKVIKAIVKNNKFNISEVLNLQNIKSTNFDISDYDTIVDLIKVKDIAGVQNWSPVKKRFL